MASVKISPVICVIMFLHLHVTSGARAPESSAPVNFQSSVEPREGRQSVLGCLRGCTRELRPVRGEQRGREVILPNKCTFDIEVCRSKRNRQSPLFLSRDQSNIVYPSTNTGK
eukprot:TRINITY_DN3170_c0_g1_i3.p1 TRINITY_DN3170_c0_g1~~TRINITY_DN3170_c0_g1_i3.p1  ORF type:complete len:113 (-),score=30.99 TRINITY_DN3170_c0_g1_i3:88-426(-)